MEQRALWLESMPGAARLLSLAGGLRQYFGNHFCVVHGAGESGCPGRFRVPAHWPGGGPGDRAASCRASRDPRNFIRTENIIGATPVYWLLLDLIQGTSALPGVTVKSVMTTFAMIGLCTAFFWLGTLGKPWPMPKSFVASCALRPPIWALFGL